MHLPHVSAAVLCALLLGPELPGQDKRYLEDFEFIRKSVAQASASLRSKKIDWKGACKRLRPLFAGCKSDVDHVANIMKLLAVLEDSHTDVWRTSVDRSQLPSKWDGLYGGGLWFAWENGRIMLRGIMKGHSLEGTVPLGSALVRIGDRPAWLAVERERRRIQEWWGSSSDHSLFSSLGNRFLPFGESQSLECLFLSPEGKTRKVELRRWGPGGKAFYPWTVQFPEGVTWKKGALARMLETKWCRKLGWLRITGSMDEATVRAFHRAFDTLRGMEALLLDCRSMGGGSDSEAWEMAGRLFEKPVPNGSGRRLEPTGSWQFAGPVVMLQNESEVSSAETFTWAVSETERVVSVGRPTGGWGIIPEIHKCPSGLVDFRLGVNDRPTPIKGIRTEGVGWPPDIRVPYGPVFCARADPDREIGMECLRLLHAGVTRKQLLDAFQSLFRGDLAGYRRKAARLEKKAKGWKSKLLDDRVRDDLKATLVMELRLLEEKKVVAPDALGARERVKELALRARKAKLAGLASRWQKALSKLKNEAKAQETLLDLLDTDFTLDPKQKKSFLEKHGKTRLGRWVREKL